MTEEGIVVLGVCVSACLSVRRAATADAATAVRASLFAEPPLQAHRISLCGEGNALYPAFCSYHCILVYGVDAGSNKKCFRV